MTNQLISCPDCANQISPDAETCPSCGRANDWVHPELTRLVERLHELPGETEWQARGHEMALTCRYQTLRQMVGLWLFKASAVLLVGGLFAGWLLGAALAVMIIGGALTMFGYDTFRVEDLHIDLRKPGMVQHCSDRRFWQNVIRQVQAGSQEIGTVATGIELPGVQRT